MATESAGYPEHVIPMDRMESFYDEPGEVGWIMEGCKHGFTLSSTIITQTAPHGGPPLHMHNTEEIHVLPECRLAYFMAGSTFEIEGPCLVNIPAHAPHTFLNIGTEPVRLVCFFPCNEVWTNYDELGPNPLLALYGVAVQGRDTLSAE
jgi:mannose-6-phosphate isomerase-like protein (cupin superfamily)